MIRKVGKHNLRKTFSGAALIILLLAVFISSDMLKPQTNIAASETFTVFEESFEEGYGEWVPLGGQAVLDIDTRHSKKGATSLHVSGRAETWNGPSLNTSYILVPGEEYTFTAWVHHDGNAVIHNIAINLKYENADEGNKYLAIGSVDAGAGGWSKIEKTVTIPADAISTWIYFEAEDVDVGFSIDAITIAGKKKAITTSDENAGATEYIYDFEEGYNGWKQRGDAHLERSSKFSYAGSYSLYVSERLKFWNTASLRISSIIKTGICYEYSAYVMYNGKQYENEHTFMLMLEYSYEGQQVYQTIDTRVLQKGNWSRLSGEYTLPDGASNIFLYIQNSDPEDSENPTVNDTLAHYIDNVTIEDSTIKNQKQFVKDVISALIIAFSVIVIAIIILLITKKLTESNDIISNATMDTMTNAYNRNSYEMQMAHLENCPEECRKLYVTICDVNFLKHINDNYGHLKGDDAIIRCASVLADTVGKKGTVYRTGGDEFVCFTKTNMDEKIRLALMAESQQYKGYPFAVANGTASYNPEEDGPVPDIKLILARSDKEMYKNKQALKESMKKYI